MEKCYLCFFCESNDILEEINEVISWERGGVEDNECEWERRNAVHIGERESIFLSL